VTAAARLVPGWIGGYRRDWPYAQIAGLDRDIRIAPTFDSAVS
jgi:hypothetical protein